MTCINQDYTRLTEINYDLHINQLLLGNRWESFIETTSWNSNVIWLDRHVNQQGLTMFQFERRKDAMSLPCCDSHSMELRVCCYPLVMLSTTISAVPSTDLVGQGVEIA